MSLERSEQPRVIPRVRPAPSRLVAQERRAAWAFLAPSLVLFLAFAALPVLASFGISFTRWDLFTAPHFVGFENYLKILLDPIFHTVLRNTTLFVLGTVAVQMCLALGLALLLNNPVTGQAFFRVVYFLPVVSPSVAVALVWAWILNENFGLLNAFLSSLGIHNPPHWLSSTNWALPALMVVSVWQGTGYSMVLFLAGLQNIPQDVYEAGALDGAVGWKKFRYITLPLLSPTTFFVLTIQVIFSFQVFDLAFVMTDGGPSNATNTVVFYIYQNAFRFYRMGYAAAAAWLLFIVIFLVTILQYRFQNRWVHYD
jgi:multiple sugar transport system permease protein